MAKSPRRFVWPGIDRFTLLLLGAVLLASLLPARGALVPVVDGLGRALIVLIFFIHGARMPGEAVRAALGQWRLQLLMLLSTFALFPLIGLACAPLSGRLIDPALYTGLLFLCCLPSTVQSSVALTAIARGNVGAAVCAAAASNLAGVALTPLLTGLLLASQSGVSLDAAGTIIGLILLPFAIGQLLHRRLGGWLTRHRQRTAFIDRGSILLVVYGAFGKAVTGGLWQAVSAVDLLILVLLCLALFALVVVLTRLAARLTGHERADEAALVLCGSVKSLATGVPMASVLFPAAAAGAIVLPLMMFHQIQLIASAFIARAYARRAMAEEGREGVRGT
jgi:sodium/bile acid cotransporter 7